MFLLFDIGGTNLRVGVSEDGTSLDSSKTLETPGSWEKALDEIARLGKELANGQVLEKAVGGVAGPLDRQKRQLAAAPNLPGFEGKPLADELEKRLICPVFLENDAALAGLGEAVFGAGKEASLVAYLTISTGVGGAKIEEGWIDESTFGFEPGHQIIEASTGRTLEESVSGTAIKRLYGQEPAEIKDEEIWLEIAKNLAIGLNNVIVHWSPEMVILGGSVMKTLSLNLVQEQLQNTLKIFKQMPVLKLSQLKDEAGLFGALAMVKNLEGK